MFTILLPIHQVCVTTGVMHAYGELARFTYCLLQKIKSVQSLPSVEKWEEFMLPNCSRFTPIEFGGKSDASALEKVGSFYLRNEIRKDARKFLEDLTSTVLSTVPAPSDVGQGLSCFFHKIVVEGMTMPLFICLASF